MSILKTKYLIIGVCIALLMFAKKQEFLSSGHYGALKIAYDPQQKLITGYYENATGFDPRTNEPRFSCLFYIEGVRKNGFVRVKVFTGKETAAQKVTIGWMRENELNSLLLIKLSITQNILKYV
ncbi:MAG: hypothetical protein ABUK01_11520 [Leptospirales bacterium]